MHMHMHTAAGVRQVWGCCRGSGKETQGRAKTYGDVGKGRKTKGGGWRGQAVYAAREAQAPLYVTKLLSSAHPEVRAAAVFALGCFILVRLPPPPPPSNARLLTCGVAPFPRRQLSQLFHFRTKLGARERVGSWNVRQNPLGGAPWCL